MSVMSKITTLLTSVAVACCTAVVTTLAYNYFHKEEQEVIFFHGKKPNCDYHRKNTNMVVTLDNECSLCKTNKIIKWLSKANKTLDVCMYTLSHAQLSNAIIDAHKRGVHVRLIVNKENGGRTWDMVTLGIKNRTNKYSSGDCLMHHKFIIIDSKYVILGSMNWTREALRNNWENVFITNEKELVNPFMKEFQKLWIALA